MAGSSPTTTEERFGGNHQRPDRRGMASALIFLATSPTPDVILGLDPRIYRGARSVMGRA